MSSSGDPVSSGLITEDWNNAGTRASTEVLSLQGEGTVKGDVKTCQEAARGGRVQRARERGRGSSGGVRERRELARRSRCLMDEPPG